MINSIVHDGKSADLTTKEWYQGYYAQQGQDRNDLLSNPEVLFQTLAFEKANVRALSRLGLNPRDSLVLDVGCGNGGSLLTFIRLGFDPANLFGVDIDGGRIADARRRLPNVKFQCENGSNLSFRTGVFDIVFESTMFVQLLDEELSASVASEMLRVVRTGGFIVLVDWRYSKPFNTHYKGLSRARIARLFKVGKDSAFHSKENGALIPPLGRFLSRYLGPVYFPIQFLLPFAVGQVTTVLKKR